VCVFITACVLTVRDIFFILMKPRNLATLCDVAKPGINTKIALKAVVSFSFAPRCIVRRRTRAGSAACLPHHRGKEAGGAPFPRAIQGGMLGAGSAGVSKMPDGAGKRTSKQETRLLRFSVLLVLQLLGSLEPHSANSATLTVRSLDEICCVDARSSLYPASLESESARVSGTGKRGKEERGTSGILYVSFVTQC
jgi:hypothetical protein